MPQLIRLLVETAPLHPPVRFALPFHTRISNCPRHSYPKRKAARRLEMDDDEGLYQKVTFLFLFYSILNIPLRNASSWVGFNSILRWYSRSASSLLFFAKRISPNNLCPRYVSSTAMESLAHLDRKK